MPFSWKFAKATGRKTGVGDRVGLFIPLPRNLAKKFPTLIPEDESPSHITFLSIGPVLDTESQDNLLRILKDCLRRWWPRCVATLGDLQYFDHFDKDRRVAYVDVDFDKDVSAFKHRLKQELLDAGIPVNDSFVEYKPHVTLGYLPGMDSTWKGRVPRGSWDFDQIEVWGLPKVHHLKVGPSAKRVARKSLQASLEKTSCIIVGKDFDGHLCLLKNRDRSYDTELQIIHMEFNGVEMAFVLDLETGYMEGVNEHGIGVVNTTLMVLHDEKEGQRNSKSDKKTTVKSKDGPKIFHALLQDNLEDAVRTLVTFEGGIRGHTFVADGKKLVSIECTRKNPARVHRLDPQRTNTRTNHGISYPEAGYTHGQDYVSSIVRRWEAQKRLQDVHRLDKAAPALIEAIDDADSPFNPVRVTGKMRTTSQLLIDTTQPSLYLYLIPGHSRVHTPINILPNSREPKIPVRVFRYNKKMEDRSFRDIDGDEEKESQDKTAKYKSKKTIKTESGEREIYEYGPRQVLNRHKEKAQRLEKLRKSISDLRKKYRRDLQSEDATKRSIALVVALIDETYERPGNAKSAEGGHFGVTTWRRNHIKFKDGKAHITYVGKSGVRQKKTVENPLVVKALRDACKGVDSENCCVVGVTAKEVNEYLSPFEITSKDLRGFHANREMANLLKKIRKEGPELPWKRKEREEILKKEFSKALAETAKVVGHTESILRKQYLVPEFENQYLQDGTVLENFAKRGRDLRVAALFGTPIEKRILANALNAPVLVAKPISWWEQYAPNLYRKASVLKRKTPEIPGIQFPSSFSMFWYEGEDGDRYPMTLGSPEEARGTHSRMPILQHTVLQLNDDGTSSTILVPMDIISPMVRSGDWDASDAFMVGSLACERCMNVLDHHYTGKGYSFGSDEYWMSCTRCDLCAHVDNSPEKLVKATKTHAEREDDQVAKLLRREPKKNPPRYDLRNNRTLQDEDPDLEGMGGGDKGDRDLSMKWNKVASFIAYRWAKKKSKNESEFQTYVEGKVFRNPKSGEKVKFRSLPQEEQTKIYTQWESKLQKDKARVNSKTETEDSKTEDSTEPEAEGSNTEPNTDPNTDPEVAPEDLLEEMENVIDNLIDNDMLDRDQTQIIKKLSEEQIQFLAKSFKKTLKKLTKLDPLSDEAIAIAKRFKLPLSDVGKSEESAKNVGERLAEKMYVNNVLSNPMIIGGKKIGTKPIKSSKEYGDRAQESFNQFQKLPTEIREKAAETLSKRLKQVDPESDEAQELEAVLTGINLAHIAGSGESLPGRPQPNEGMTKLIKALVEQGDASQLFKPTEDMFTEESRKTIAGALRNMSYEDFAVFAFSEGNHPYSSLEKDLKSGPSEFKAVIKDFLVNDFLNDVWGDRAARDYMEAAKADGHADPKVRAQVLREAKGRVKKNIDSAMGAMGRVFAARKKGENPSQEDEKLVSETFEGESAKGLVAGARAILQTLRKRFKGDVKSPAASALDHFVREGDPSIFSQEIHPHPDQSQGNGPSGHSAGDVWRTESGSWRAMNTDGTPKTFRSRSKAQEFAKTAAWVW